MSFLPRMLNPNRILRLVCHDRSLCDKSTANIVLSRGSADVVNAGNVDTSIAYKTKLQRANSARSRFTTSFTVAVRLMEIRLFTAAVSSDPLENFRISSWRHTHEEKNVRYL